MKAFEFSRVERRLTRRLLSGNILSLEDRRDTSLLPASNLSCSPRRELTENKLLDALEIVLVRDGIRQLSLNAIVDEAGVGKPLLYRYFGNLRGLLTAWVERRGPQPAGEPEATAAIGAAHADHAEFLAEVADQMVGSADQLRAQPVLLEMLAEELTANSELSEPFATARRQQSKRFVRAMLRDPRYTNPKIRGRIILLYAAINYLAMRARRSPNFMGLRLDTRAGWQEAMDMIRELIMNTNDSGIATRISLKKSDKAYD